MTAPEDPDRELMLSLRAGNDLALNRLMERWEEPLRRFVFRYLADETESLEVAQETFVRVYLNRGRYQPSARFSTWLFTIALNLCRNRARWKRRHPTESLDALDPVGEIGAGLPRERADLRTLSPARLLADSERAAAVRDAIQALPEDLKEAVLLFEFEDKSYAEVAAVVGATPKAVENRLYRARQLLRKSLSSWLS